MNTWNLIISDILVWQVKGLNFLVDRINGVGWQYFRQFIWSIYVGMQSCGGRIETEA